MSGSPIDPDTIVNHDVLMANGNLARVTEYVKNTRYCFIGHSIANNKGVKWTQYGFGLYTGTSIVRVDPTTVIDRPGMYVTNKGERILIRKPEIKRADNRWVGIFDDGDIAHFTHYGTQGNKSASQIIEKANIIDSEGGIFFTNRYMVCIKPNSEVESGFVGRIIVDSEDADKGVYFWNANGYLSPDSSVPPDVITAEMHIVDKFIPTPRKWKSKMGTSPIHDTGEYLTKNNSVIIIEGRAPFADQGWYGYAKGDKTNHHVWDKFGRVYVFEKDQWVVNARPNDLDIKARVEGNETVSGSENDDEPDVQSKKAGKPSKPPKLRFEIGKRYNTPGDSVSIIIDILKDSMFVYNYRIKATQTVGLDGKSPDANHFDLISEYVEPVKGSVWINVFRNATRNKIATGYTNKITTHVYSDRDLADEDADEMDDDGAKRIARVKVEWKEGQLDE